MPSLSPVELIGEALDSHPDLVGQLERLVGPAHQERHACRRSLISSGHIQQLPTVGERARITAVDGAYVAAPLVVGDHVAALSVAVTYTPNPQEVDIDGRRHWAAIRPHSDDSETFARAIMMLNETALAADVSDDAIGIIDGSHLTAAIAVNSALGGLPATDAQEILESADANETCKAFTAIAEAKNVVACPKSNSSTALWDALATDLRLSGRGLPDKAFTAVILDPGEVLLHHAPAPPWDRLASSHGRIRSAEQRSFADRAEWALGTLRQPGLRVLHAKPHASDAVIRMEVKPTLDMGESIDLAAAICSDVDVPQLQEPFVQYLADHFAKHISVAASHLLDNLTIDDTTSAGQDLYRLLRSYRTT